MDEEERSVGSCGLSASVPCSLSGAEPLSDRRRGACVSWARCCRSVSPLLQVSEGRSTVTMVTTNLACPPESERPADGVLLPAVPGRCIVALGLSVCVACRSLEACSQSSLPTFVVSISKLRWCGFLCLRTSLSAGGQLTCSLS